MSHRVLWEARQMHFPKCLKPAENVAMPVYQLNLASKKTPSRCLAFPRHPLPLHLVVESCPKCSKSLFPRRATPTPILIPARRRMTLRVPSSVLPVRAHQLKTGSATQTLFLGRSPLRTAGVVRSSLPFLRSQRPLASRRRRPGPNLPQQSKPQLRLLPPRLTSLSDDH